MSLSYGLNVPKKKALQSTRPAPAKRKTIFDDDSASDDGPEEDTPEAIETLGGLSLPYAPKSSPSLSKSKLKSPNNQPSQPPSLKKKSFHVMPYADLSSNHTANKHAASAQSVDSSIYDYDAVYDSLHAQPAKKSAGSVGPKYMENLLASAEIRKRDQLRAKEKMLLKEREAEGEEYAGKEKFVTGAYKAQQEEVKRLEDEETLREEEAEKRRRKGGGMVGLYRGMLEREEKRHEAINKALEEGRDHKTNVDDNSDKDLIEQAGEVGAAINDEGQIVDKRQLLSAGLNITAKPTPARDLVKSKGTFKPSPSMVMLSGQGGGKAAFRERQTRMLENQLDQAAKRAAEDEEVEQEALKRSAKSKKTENEVSSARERYLQRKKAAEAEKAAAIGS